VIAVVTAVEALHTFAILAGTVGVFAAYVAVIPAPRSTARREAGRDLTAETFAAIVTAPYELTSCGAKAIAAAALADLAIDDADGRLADDAMRAWEMDTPLWRLDGPVAWAVNRIRDVEDERVRASR
jgi:hypothetical protein